MVTDGPIVPRDTGQPQHGRCSVSVRKSFWLRHLSLLRDREEERGVALPGTRSDSETVPLALADDTAAFCCVFNSTKQKSPPPTPLQ